MIFLPILLWFSVKGQEGVKTNRVFPASDQCNIYGTICAKFLIWWMQSFSHQQNPMENIKFLN